MGVMVIAEAGVNHNGSLATAKKLVDAAKSSGADYVKFQTFSAKSLAHQKAKKAEYQSAVTDAQESQYEMLEKLELTFNEFRQLKNYCESLNIGFLSTAFDIESLNFVVELGVDYLKVPSGEITNFQLLSAIAKVNMPTLISTGMCYLEEVRGAVEHLVSSGLNREYLSVFHCNTEYPTPMEDVHLRAMVAMGKELDLPFGYSDHTQGITVPIAAVAMGATVIEKHFTLDKSLPGPDHLTSLEPNALKDMVQAIRDVEQCLGGDEKVPSPSEFKNRMVARRSLYAKGDIAKGEEFTEDNVVLLRPAEGLSGIAWFDVLGTRAKRDYKSGDALLPEEVSR